MACLRPASLSGATPASRRDREDSVRTRAAHCRKLETSAKEKQMKNRQTTGILRQGDVLLVPSTEEIPREAKQSESLTLAEGEATGHAHVLINRPGVRYF